MDKLAERSEQLLQAYSRLGHIIATYQELESKLVSCLITQTNLNVEEAHIVCRDSVIKRFEFCFDSTWKFLKLLLKIRYDIDVASPRFTFQESLQHKFISISESQILELLLNSRNYTAHIYSEEMADLVAKDVVKHFPETHAMVQRLVRIN